MSETSRLMSEIATLEDFPSRQDRQAKIAKAEREVIAAAMKWWRTWFSRVDKSAIGDMCIACRNLADLKGGGEVE